jgi:multimeric flavodoxin WrbA
VKVVAFDGSKEPRGSVGVRVARLVERLQAAGVEAELVRLERFRQTGCTMCAQCGHRTGAISCSAPPEDGLRRAVRKLKAADAIVIGTPAYGTTSSPATQEVLMRLEHDRREKGDVRLAGKPAFVIVGPRGRGTGAVVAAVRRQLEAHAVTVVGVLETAGPDEADDAGVGAAAVALRGAACAPEVLAAPVS